MPFLTLNGVEVPVAAGSDSTLQLKRFGSAGRSYAGEQRHSYRAYKREWKLRTPPLVTAEAEALRALIEGRGAHWRFDATSSYDADHGLTCTLSPPNSPDLTLTTETGGSVCLELKGYTVRLTCPLPAASSWTWVVRSALSGSVWQNRVIRSDGARWADGVSSTTMEPGPQTYDPTSRQLVLSSSVYGGTTWAASQARALASTCENGGLAYKCIGPGTTGLTPPAWPASYGATVIDGSVTWQNVGSARVRWAMLTWLPYLVPDTWAAQFHTAMTTHGKTFGSLPNLIARGTFVGGASVLVAGEVGESEFAEFNQAGVRQPGQVFDFILREV